jgi:hypothetical protein
MAHVLELYFEIERIVDGLRVQDAHDVGIGKQQLLEVFLLVVRAQRITLYPFVGLFAEMPRCASSSSTVPENTTPRDSSRFCFMRSTLTTKPFTMRAKRRSMWSSAMKLSGRITRSTDECEMSRSCQSAMFSRPRARCLSAAARAP